ncbi:hypothetical protein KBD45_05545 [Candidatus Dojkabacteria bacterium]|nr:hypothetical protein [Candidatus Dojkabacteria bacterium]
MSTLLIIDDDPSQRELLKSRFELYIQTNNLAWDLMAIAPPTNFDSIRNLILEEDVSVLITDERLNEVQEDTQCNYTGHHLVTALRSNFKSLPIFIISTYQTDTIESREESGDWDYVINRNTFNTTDSAKREVKRILRSAQRYSEENESQLVELGEISKKIIQNEASDEERSRIAAIRQTLDINSGSISSPQYSELTNEFGRLVDQLEILRADIQGELTKKK